MPRDLIGETLLNQFRVESYVASGGMATIYRVWDLQRNVPLAMKVLHPELADDPALMARFQREASSLQTLVHPHIVPFYGLYRAPDLTFMLERFIDGPSLDEVLRARAGRPLPLIDSLVYFKALYTSLGYAHAQGIIHCDVKPGNVLIDQGGGIYLTDFGIARYMDTSITTSSALGTPLYMAPEQIRGERLSPATDVYSLGVLMFEMLTGRRPFNGDRDVPEGVGRDPSDRVRYQHLYLPPPDPRAINPNLPEGLAQVVLTAMAKDPRERYPSVQSMADEISRIVAARFETLPNRVDVAQEMGTARTGHNSAYPEWLQGGEQAPAEWAASDDQVAYDPMDDQGAAAGWEADQARPRPLDTLPGRPEWPPVENRPYSYAEEGPASQRARGLPLRWLLPLAALVLAAVCLTLFIGWLRMRGQAAAVVPPASATAAATATITHTPKPGETITAPPSTPTTAAATPAPAGAGDFTVPGTIAIIQKINAIDTLVLLDGASGATNRVPPVPNVQMRNSNAPQWSPDGQKITWIASYNSRPHVVVMDMTEQEPYQLPAAEQYNRLSSPAFLPDGARVSFYQSSSSGSSLVTANATSGEKLDEVALEDYRNLYVWNWQNGQVAFVDRPAGPYRVVVSGSPISDDLVLDTGAEAYAPAWSKDGQWIAFQTAAQRDAGADEIWIARADGSQMRRVTNSPEGVWSRAPSWSPDGQFIAFVSSRAGSLADDYGELFVVEVATGKVRQMTDTGGRIYDWRPAWRP